MIPLKEGEGEGEDSTLMSLCSLIQRNDAVRTAEGRKTRMKKKRGAKTILTGGFNKVTVPKTLLNHEYLLCAGNINVNFALIYSVLLMSHNSSIMKCKAAGSQWACNLQDACLSSRY